MKHSENKKILNATPLEYDGIQFKSKLEKMAYQTLRENSLPVEYEPKKFIIWEGFKPTVPFYDKDKVTRMLKLDSKKLVSISYTPDFLIKYNGYLVVLEMKGALNDTYPIKRKMFRKWLEENEPKSIYFEIYTKKQLLQAIEIIKNLK
jgi:hypothetical protein